MMEMNLNNKIYRKLASVLAISTTLLMFFIGAVNIKNTGLPFHIPIIVIIFAIGFVLGSLFSENRNGVYPWTLMGGFIISIIITVVITCVFSGVIFSSTGGLFKTNTDLLIYSFSACMIFSVIALNIISNKDIFIMKLQNELCDQDLEYYNEDNSIESDGPHTPVYKQPRQ